MKKCYKAPVAFIIDVDVEGLVCTSPGQGEEKNPDFDAAEVRDSYRSSLWND